MLAPIHFSTLKHIAQSPAHYLYSATHPPPQSAAFRLGSAVDAFCIGEGERVVTCPHRKNTKAYAEWAETTMPVDAIVLNATEFAKATEMADSLARHKQAMELLQGERQRYVEWSWLGRHCAGTPDVFSLEQLVELKTGRTAQPERFMAAAKWYGYHAQLAWYRRGLIESGFGTPASYWIVAVESSPPYPTTVFRLTDSALDLGERMCRAWLERLLTCEAADSWPAYVESAVPFDIVEEEGFTLKIDGEDVEVE